jgi:hypothetical protein
MHPGFQTTASCRSRSFVLPTSLTISCLLLLIAMDTALGQFVNIAGHIDCTWHSPRGDHSQKLTVRCVVGTNTWYIKGHFAENAEIAYWSVGTNVAQQVTITSSQYLRQIDDFVSRYLFGRKPLPGIPVHDYPKRGQTYVFVHSSPEEQPTDNGVANAVWLAFCSGLYLRREGRQVPMPITLPSRAWGYRDQTEVFADRLGLPRQVKHYSLDNQLVCTYQVLESTNFFGWTIPLRFKLRAYQGPGNGVAGLGVPPTDLEGTLTSLSAGEVPQLPEEVKKRLPK